MDAPLTLYHLGYCPYCQKVRRAAAELGIDLALVDVDEEPAARQYLIDHLGRSTVPVLGIPTESGEQLLPESDDIVVYLRANAKHLTPRRVA